MNRMIAAEILNLKIIKLNNKFISIIILSIVILKAKKRFNRKHPKKSIKLMRQLNREDQLLIYKINRML